MKKINLKNLSGDEKLKYALYAVMLISFVFLVVYPVYGIDVWYWLYRIDAIAEYVQNYGITALPVRITESAYGGYGYGAPLFYGDIFLILPSLFVAAGMPLISGYSLLALELWGGRFFIAYFSARYFLKKMQVNTSGKEKQVALLFAFLYEFFPYMMECLFFRAAMGEVSASMIFPLIASSFYVLMFSDKADTKDSVLLAIGMSVLICSHVLSTVIICCVLVVFFVAHLRSMIKKKHIKYFVYAVILTIVLTAYWSLPFMEQMLQSYITVNGVAGQASLYGSRVNLVELLFPNLVYSVYYIYKNGEDMGINSFWPSCYVYLVLLAVVLCIWAKEKWRESLPKRLVGYSCILAIFMSCGPILKIADQISFFRVLQFPWRLLLIVALFLAVSFTYYYFKLEKKFLKNLILLAAVSCAVVVSAKNVYTMTTSGEELILTALERDGASSYADALYQPQGAVKSEIKERGEIVLSSDPSLNYTWSRENGTIVLTYSDCEEPTTFELPLLYYYGYSAYDSDNECYLPVEKSEHGLVEVTIQENNAGTFVVSYTGTKVQHVSKWISILGWIGIIIWGIQPMKRYRQILRKN